jgi:hypothetical protein
MLLVLEECERANQARDSVILKDHRPGDPEPVVIVLIFGTDVF